MKGDITYVDAGNGLVMLDDGNGSYITTAANTVYTNNTVYTSNVMDATEARANKLEPICTDEEWETFCNEVGLINE